MSSCSICGQEDNTGHLYEMCVTDGHEIDRFCDDCNGPVIEGVCGCYEGLVEMEAGETGEYTPLVEILGTYRTCDETGFAGTANGAGIIV